jgi:hypothetical protein
MTWESAHIPPVAPAGPGGGNTGDGSQRAPQGAFVRRQRPYSGSQPGTCSRCFSGNQDATSRNAALATSRRRRFLGQPVAVMISGLTE